MASKQLEFVSGAVQQVNSKKNGIKVAGFDEWLNVSQYHPLPVVPSAGELVEVQFEQTERGAWINSLRIIGTAPAGPTSAPGRDEEIRRLACLKAAAAFCGHKATVVENVGTAEVLKVAEAFERWVLKGGPDAD